ncbi:AraC-like DNA-binding protein [Chryseobacterium sp. H1D6B]|uniref:helix-turn-helix domain-containing protein n=1 Tax=Chryseobacterium sp. H1D6B TaxID=2940588 RepID=UPI0015CE5FE6|nr:AraC family transcriptional regulator [Chryseobacterium sp. H1D6B]MDH6250617.1 AraC-like DNA-binding protein [Chryseobacterium sp. H1D6B]
MKVTEITSCYIGPEISPEQFVSEHFFLYLGKGEINGYDGRKQYRLKEGGYCLVRKNSLTRYNKEKVNGRFEKVVIIFDEKFLKSFKEKHQTELSKAIPHHAFVRLEKNHLVQNFIQSLMPYYNGKGEINETFADLKREELLLILLQSEPDLKNILFDFGIPQKIDLEAFMQNNYKFNVSIERFAYLTGRSLASFKRDFKTVFNQSPSRWLVHKRLQEAFFLIHKKGKSPSEIYLDLGFENLSHFSFAFKKEFGNAPSFYSKAEI